MDEYYLSKEDWDTVVELGVGESRDDVVLKNISTATKTSLTKKFVPLSHCLAGSLGLMMCTCSDDALDTMRWTTQLHSTSPPTLAESRRSSRALRCQILKMRLTCVTLCAFSDIQNAFVVNPFLVFSSTRWRKKRRRRRRTRILQALLGTSC